MGDLTDIETVSKEELEQALSVIKKFKTSPVRGYEFQLRARQLLRAPVDVLFLRAILRNIDYIVNKDIDYSLLDDSNIVIVVWGLKRVGKSELLKGLASHIVSRTKKFGIFPDPQIHLTFSNDETTSVIKHKAKPGDIIWQDEIIEQSGEDSLTQKKQIFNLQENLAKKHIHFLFASNKKRGFEEISNFVLLPTHKDREKRMNTALVFYKSELDSRLIPLGKMKLPLSTDEELTEIYNIRKQAYVDSLQDSGGFSMVKVDEIRSLEDIETVEKLMEKKLEEIPIFDWKKSWIHSFIREAYIVGSNAYLDYIRTKIEINIVRKKALLKRELESQESSSSQPPEVGRKDFDSYLREVGAQKMVDFGYCQNKNHGMRFMLRNFFLKEEPSYNDIARTLKERRGNSVETYLKRLKKDGREPNETEKGTMLEIAFSEWMNHKNFLETMSSTDSPKANKWHQDGSSGRCDVWFGTEEVHLVCINCKVNLDMRPSWEVKVNPEYEHNPNHCFVALWTQEKGLEIHYVNKVRRKEFFTAVSSEDIGIEGLIKHVKRFW